MGRTAIKGGVGRLANARLEEGLAVLGAFEGLTHAEEVEDALGEGQGAGGGADLFLGCGLGGCGRGSGWVGGMGCCGECGWVGEWIGHAYGRTWGSSSVRVSGGVEEEEEKRAVCGAAAGLFGRWRRAACWGAPAAPP